MTRKYKFHAIFENKSLNKTLAIFQNILDKKSVTGNEYFTETKITLNSDSNIAVFSGVNSTIIGLKECEAIIMAVGKVVVNAHIFYDIVRKISAPEIEVFQEENVDLLVINAGKFTCRIPLQSEDRIPDKITTNNFTSQCIIYNKDLSMLLESILFVVPNSDPRPYLCGLKLIKTRTKLEFAGTDCHRLAVSFANLITADDEEIEMIVPKKTLHEINRQIKDNPEDETTITFTTHKIGFFLDNCRTIIISKLIHGSFPNYQSILEEEQYSSIRINTKFFIEAIERSLIILDDKNTKAISIGLEINSISLTAQSDNKGYVYETIDDCVIEHKNEDKKCTNIVVNAYYLLEMTKNVKSEQTVLCINDKTRPVLIRDEGNSNKFYFLMPMMGL